MQHRIIRSLMVLITSCFSLFCSTALAAPSYTVSQPGSAIIINAVNNDDVGYMAQIEFDWQHDGLTSPQHVNQQSFIKPNTSGVTEIYRLQGSYVNARVVGEVAVKWLAMGHAPPAQPSPGPVASFPYASPLRLLIVSDPHTGPPNRGGLYTRLDLREVVKGTAFVELPTPYFPADQHTAQSEVEVLAQFRNLSMQALNYDGQNQGGATDFGLRFMSAMWNPKTRQIRVTYVTDKTFSTVVELFVKIEAEFMVQTF